MRLDVSPCSAEGSQAAGSDGAALYVSAGSCGSDGAALAQQTAMLRTNWRFKDTPGIGELALAVNGGDPAAVARVFQQQRPGLRGLSLGEETDALTDLLLDGDGQHPGLRALFADVATPPADGQPDSWAAQRLRQLTGQQLLSGLRSGPA